MASDRDDDQTGPPSPRAPSGSLLAAGGEEVNPPGGLGAPAVAIDPAQALALLRDQFGVDPGTALRRCRINYFDAGLVALVPGALYLCRVDLLGRYAVMHLPLHDVGGVALVDGKRKQRSVTFSVEDQAIRVDGLGDADWVALRDHVTASAGPEPPASPPPEPPPPVDPGEAPPAPSPPPAPLAPPPVIRPVNPIDQYLRDLDHAPDLAPILRRLFHECQAQEQRDRALIVAQALAALGQAGPLEQQHVARFRSPRLLRIDRPLAPAELEQLLDLPAGDRALGPLIEALLPAVIRLTSRPRKDFGLGPSNPQASALLFSRILDYVRSRLGAGEVEVHPMPGRPSGLAVASVMEKDGWRPVLVVGADLLSGRSEPELAFVIARELTSLRQPMLLRALVPDLATQALLVLAAIGLSRPDPAAEARQPGLREQIRHLSAHLTLDDFERVGAAVRGLDAVGEPFDLPRWNAAADRFALRVGLLLSGDLEVAARWICPPGSSASRAPLRDLIRFAVSSTHLTLRQSLGLAIRD